MNKVAISKEIREFTHKGKAEGKLLEKVRAEQMPAGYMGN